MLTPTLLLRSTMKKKQLSVVVPTYEEQSNIRPLTTRLFAAAQKKDGIDLLFVDDDSGEGTIESERL